MGNMSRKMRNNLRLSVKFGLKTFETTRKIRTIEWYDKISEQTTQKWFESVKQEDLTLEIKPRNCKPVSGNSDVLKQNIERNPTTGIRKLAGKE
ncbi:hypothetical protein AVEN_90010-1 [Araneus ventricosus]|uniref:Mos1 transposase HTH domain-containing protein n=1 Tax=Araneus ventricosus TaxID=182803 RepID=A0A4Y2DDY7_ARAVE|nr:hypothetical protein AVEN_90010-1 [Araneus ventricosus]